VEGQPVYRQRQTQGPRCLLVLARCALLSPNSLLPGPDGEVVDDRCGASSMQTSATRADAASRMQQC